MSGDMEQPVVETWHHGEWALVGTRLPGSDWVRWVPWRGKVQHQSFATLDDARSYADEVDELREAIRAARMGGERW